MSLLPLTRDGFPVGLLFSDSSLTAAVEKTQSQATLLAIEEVNAAGGINGISLKPTMVEIGSDPSDYRRAAEHLCDKEHVRILFGTHMSNGRKAVLPVVEARNALLFYPTLYEGFEYSAHCIYTGAAPNQNIVQLAGHILANHGSRIVLIGNNYIYAHESNRIMRDLFEDAGGEVLDEIYLPLNAPLEDVEAVIKRAEQCSPDAVYSTVVGADTIKLYEAFARSHLKNRNVPIASLATNEADIAAMSADVAEGHLSSAPYFETLPSPESRAFVRRYKQRFGEESPITAGAEAAYFQVQLFAAAMRQATSSKLLNLLDKLGQVKFKAPQGEVKIDPGTHHTYLWPRIARVDTERTFRVIEEEKAAVRPEPYMIQHSFESHGAKEA